MWERSRWLEAKAVMKEGLNHLTDRRSERCTCTALPVISLYTFLSSVRQEYWCSRSWCPWQEFRNCLPFLNYKRGWKLIPLCFATPVCVELSASDHYQRTAQVGRALRQTASTKNMVTLRSLVATRPTRQWKNSRLKIFFRYTCTYSTLSVLVVYKIWP